MRIPVSVMRMPTGQLMARVISANPVPTSGINGRNENAGFPVIIRITMATTSKWASRRLEQ